MVWEESGEIVILQLRQVSIKGIFLINKPIGITSHDVIDRLRKITGERRIGHAGTLDPLASGLLIVAIGREFTKQLDKFLKLNKEYEAEIVLGKISDTYDAEGKIEVKDDKEVSEKEIVKVLNSFLGENEQMPPVFSAKKIKGKRAYSLARAGLKVDLKPQLINISKIKLLNYAYPKVKFEVEVSSGTYIRSLAHDIGNKLGVGAYLSSLIRTRIGKHSLTLAGDLDKIKEAEQLELYKVRE